MSAYNEVSTIYKDEECLLQALKEMGYSEVEVHETAQNLIGYHSDVRTQQAHIIIRRKNISSASNDIGYFKNADGSYTEIISDYDKGRHDLRWRTGLKSKYGEAGAMKTARKKGFKFLGRTVVNGKIQLRFQDRKAG
jgi:hypothetical protein